MDPLGGAATAVTGSRSTSIYKTNITVVNPEIDPTFSFMTVDHDGKIRMDPSSPYAMARLVELKDRFRVAFANDPDSDRHGIVTRSAGLLNPNHYLAVAIRYLLTHRPHWPADAAVGKTLVSSSLIDRVVEKLGRRLYEVPVGFKWFVPGLFDGSCCFGGEESAGASFLRHDGTRVDHRQRRTRSWTCWQPKSPLAPDKDPGEHYQELAAEFGTPYYTRIDAPATPAQKARLRKLSPARRDADTLAGERITARLTSGSRQQRADWRPENRDRERMVRRAAVRHREHLQDLRGKLQRRGASRRARERGGRTRHHARLAGVREPVTICRRRNRRSAP